MNEAILFKNKCLHLGAFNDKSLLEKLEAEKFDLGIAEPMGLTGFGRFSKFE